MTGSRSASRRTLISGAAVVTVDDQRTVLDPGWVLIDGRTIVGIGPGDPTPEIRAGADEELQLPGHVVMPGMTNANTHLFQTFFRGLADDLPLLDWLRDCIWPGAEHIDHDTAYHAARLGLL